MITTNTAIVGTTRIVTAHDPVTETSVVTYRGNSAFLANEAHHYLTHYLNGHPDATIADIRTVFHTEED